MGVFTAAGHGINVACKITGVEIAQQKMIIYIKKIAAAGEHFIKECGRENTVVDDQRICLGDKFVGDIIVDQSDVPSFYGHLGTVYVVSAFSLCHISNFHKIVGMVGGGYVDHATINICRSF